MILGERIAAILNNARGCPTLVPAISPEGLEEITPLLLSSGGGALCWWRIQHSNLQSTPAADELHQAYRLHTLQAAIKGREIAALFSFLRSQELDPLMGKGWVIARQYPELGLRPYGDIDLYVRPEQHSAFVTALNQSAAQHWEVDLHRGASELNDRSFDELYARSQLALCNGVEVRIFGPEDHLRLLCLHFLREGALRPLWLCDIAVALKALPPDFDWDYFLSGDERRTDWAASAIGLAHQLLGANVSGLPVEARAKNLPRWLVPVVLQQWGTGKVTKGRRTPMAVHLRYPQGMLRSLRERWPNAIEATVGMRGSFNNWPRLPYQLGDCVRRTAGFAWQIPQLLRSAR